MIARAQIYRSMPKDTKILSRYNGINNSGIIDQILKDTPEAINISKPIAKYFKGKTDLDTAKNVWRFLRSQIIYRKDPADHQIIRMPSYFIRSGHGDCKSFSLFAVSVFYNLGIPVSYRFTSYDSDRRKSHVYTYIFDRDNSRFIYVDGTYPFFDRQKLPITYLNDYSMRMTTIAGTSGVNCSFMAGWDDEDYISAPAKKPRQQKKQDKKQAKTQKKHQLKTKVKQVKTNVKAKAKQAKTKVKAASKKAVKTLKKVGLAAPRTSFLSLVLLNFRNLATNMVKISQRDPARLKKIWTALGGDYNTLLKTAQKGSSRKPLFSKRVNGFESINSVSIAAALASALPVLIALKPLLDAFGANKSESDDLVNESKAEYSSQGGNPEMESMIKNASNPNSGGGSQESGQPSNDPGTEPKGDDDSGGGSKLLLPLALGTGILLFALK